jgi:hypothetical protein
MVSIPCHIEWRPLSTSVASSMNCSPLTARRRRSWRMSPGSAPVDDAGQPLVAKIAESSARIGASGPRLPKTSVPRRATARGNDSQDRLASSS